MGACKEHRAICCSSDSRADYRIWEVLVIFFFLHRKKITFISVALPTQNPQATAWEKVLRSGQLPCDTWEQVSKNSWCDGDKRERGAEPCRALPPSRLCEAAPRGLVLGALILQTKDSGESQLYFQKAPDAILHGTTSLWWKRQHKEPVQEERAGSRH